MNFKNAVAEEVEPAAGSDSLLVGPVTGIRHHADHQAGVSQFDRFLDRLQEDSRRVPGRGVEQEPGGALVDAVPDGVILDHYLVLREVAVVSSQDLPRLLVADGDTGLGS